MESSQGDARGARECVRIARPCWRGGASGAGAPDGRGGSCAAGGRRGPQVPPRGPASAPAMLCMDAGECEGAAPQG
eukprot:286082-Lingulodinium_polyedra.AAC.1